MRVYLLKRLAMTVAVLLIVLVFLGLLVQIVPGDAATALLGKRASPELVAKYRSAMDLDKPVPVQVARFVWNALHGSFGNDVFSGRPITYTIGSALPHTLILAWASLMLAVLLGVPLGVYSATHPDSFIDRLTAVASISFITIPSSVIGLLLLLLFAVQLRVLPALGAGDLGNIADYATHLVLPVLALATGWVGYLARLVRTSFLEVLNETYIRAARAGGLPERVILYKYALKGALIPTIAVLGIGIGSLMGGAVLIEMIFTRPGMGSLIVKAIQQRNYPLVRAGVLVVAVLFVLANLLADLVYTYLDPRIQLGKGRG
jgi:peptide/nickel transport system permease protein